MPQRFRLICTIPCLVALLSACASVKPVSVSPQETASAFLSRSLDEPGLRKFAVSSAAMASWPPSSWDARSLDIAALYFNPSLDVSRAKWDAAKAAVASAKTIPNPVFNASPQYVTNAASGIPAWVVATSLMMIFETAGKRDFRAAHAEYLAEAARLDLRNAAWETVGAVHAALVEMAADQKAMEAFDRQITAQAALVDIAEKRVAAGLGSRIELATTRSALNKASLDREAVASDLADARHQLAEAIGIPAEAIPLGHLSAVMPERAPGRAPGRDYLDAIRMEAALNRADLLAKLAEYAASDVRLQLEGANQYPDLEIGPSYEYDQGDHKWGLSIGLPLPIFNTNDAAIAEAAAQRRQAATEFLALQASVISEVNRAVTSYESAARSLAAADELARRQTSQMAATEALFERGETDRLELLAGRVELANAQVARIAAEKKRAQALLSLQLAGQRSLDGFDPAALALRERR
jgi:outer membrane protein TolC